MLGVKIISVLASQHQNYQIHITPKNTCYAVSHFVSEYLCPMLGLGDTSWQGLSAFLLSNTPLQGFFAQSIANQLTNVHWLYMYSSL